MQFDYIIVGGGSGGATLAARLTEDPSVTVCLIEAGGDGRGIVVRAPVGVVAMLPGRPKKINNYAYETVPQPGLNGRKGYQPRGKCLGGSSAINAMLYVRGHPSDYDDWARQGCIGWSFDEVLPYFKRSEGNQRGESRLHGGKGPLKVGEQQSPRGITEDFIKAGVESGYKRNDDFNAEDQEGVGYYQVTQFYEGSKNGERCSAAAAYLHPVMDRPNLTVLLQTQARKIIMQVKRAVGVEVMRNGKVEKITAKREVVLAGGAFNTPQLLMLSGIGDPDELGKHGIPVRHALRGVGKNLQDHLDFIISCRSRQKDMFGIGMSASVAITKAMLEWRRTGKGMIATPFAEGAGFIKSSPELDRPDLQLHFVISMVDDHARKLHLGYGFSCHVCVLRPKSRGEVGLYNADPQSPPRIDPKFLSNEDDARLLLKGTKQMRAIMNAPSLAKYRLRELYTEGVHDDDTLMQHIRSRADTIYHPIGTCRMGVDDMAVVDPQLRVHGIEGLRVVDASVIPTLIGGNTNAPTIMIAERAAEWMRGGADKATTEHIRSTEPASASRDSEHTQDKKELPA